MSTTNQTKEALTANIILNYIKPACENLNVQPDEFMQTESLALLVNLIASGKYSMQQFKTLIRWKVEEYKNDIDLWGNPYILELLEICKYSHYKNS